MCETTKSLTAHWHCDHLIGEEADYVAFSFGWFVKCVICLLFLLMSLVGSVLSLWFFLNVFNPGSAGP